MQYYRDLVLAFRFMGLDGSRPALVHSSLSAFGQVKGGAEAVVGALFEHFRTVVVPTFTYQTMVIPDEGPQDNAIDYGSGKDQNKMAEIYYPDMPSSKVMGVIPETLRRHHAARRSMHPIQSFAGVNAGEVLSVQNLARPLAPIAALADRNAYVLLMGVGHTTNTSIHLGERLAGRKTFIRWALVPDFVVECPGFPSCSDGFDAIEPLLEPFVRAAQVGEALVQAVPLQELLNTVRQLVQADPLALLCDKPYCERCHAVREDVARRKGGVIIQL
jgi:aminoglycoside 3-N-acetyltransferase